MTTAARSSGHPIGEKTFGPADQELFARLSLDRNPMHMDPVAARRLMTGAQVVHGVHLLLTAIEYWSRTDTRKLTAVRCSFNHPASVGNHLQFACKEGGDEDSVQIEASIAGTPCCQMTLSTLRAAVAPPVAVTPAGPIESASSSQLSKALDEAPEAQLSRRYDIQLNDFDFSAVFPGCVRLLGSEVVAAIAGLSYFVGMVCPGLHSVFSSLSLALRDDGAASNTLAFAVDKFDRRVELFDISFDGCITGRLKAFRRPPPQRQPSMTELARQVKADEFCPSRSLVIGGSRGLGELTARLLAAGGGDVVVSYASGQTDALILREDINSAAAGRCETLKIDLLQDRFEALALDWRRFDMIYFFPTPRIFRKKAGLYDLPLLAEFLHFYVDKFYEMCLQVEAHPKPRKTKIFLPSTTFLDKRPKGMTEYAMAKAAVEVLVQDINRSFRHLTVMAPRLPRLATDQTATILKFATDSSVDALLPLLRSLHAADTPAA